MKIRLAIACALAASPAWGQATLTIYGIADAAIEWGRYDAGLVRTRLQSGDLQASRLGLRMSEDLGGGLRAHAALELGFGMNNGSGASGGMLWNRGSAVGLQGGFGRIDLGRQYAPMFWTALGAEAGTYEFANPSAMLATFHTTVTGKSGVGGFYDNLVRYRLPLMEGVEAELAWTAAGVADGIDRGANLHYARGPLWAGIAWNDYRIAPPGGAAEQRQRTWLAGAKLALGAHAVGASLMATRGMAGAPLAGDAHGWQLTARLAVAPADHLNLGLARLYDDGGRSSTATHAGIVHFLSARTQLYAYVAHVANRGEAVRGLANLAADAKLVTPGFTPTAVAAGVRHGF